MENIMLYGSPGQAPIRPCNWTRCKCRPSTPRAYNWQFSTANQSSNLEDAGTRPWTGSNENLLVWWPAWFTMASGPWTLQQMQLPWRKAKAQSPPKARRPKSKALFVSLTAYHSITSKDIRDCSADTDQACKETNPGARIPEPGVDDDLIYGRTRCGDPDDDRYYDSRCFTFEGSGELSFTERKSFEKMRFKKICGSRLRDFQLGVFRNAYHYFLVWVPLI